MLKLTTVILVLTLTVTLNAKNVNFSFFREIQDNKPVILLTRLSYCPRDFSYSRANSPYVTDYFNLQAETDRIYTIRSPFSGCPEGIAVEYPNKRILYTSTYPFASFTDGTQFTPVASEQFLVSFKRRTPPLHMLSLPNVDKALFINENNDSCRLIIGSHKFVIRRVIAFMRNIKNTYETMLKQMNGNHSLENQAISTSHELGQQLIDLTKNYEEKKVLKARNLKEKHDIIVDILIIKGRIGELVDMVNGDVGHSEFIKAKQYADATAQFTLDRKQVFDQRTFI